MALFVEFRAACCGTIVTGAVARLLVIGALIVAVSSPARAEAAPIVGEFAIGRDGRFIILPVASADREFLCLVDTGASVSAFDVSLKTSLGAQRGNKLLKTPAGHVRREAFDWPALRVGGRPLQSDQAVICLDLSEIRQATNAEIYGVIGMDILRRCLMRVDFDRGRLQFLESLPAERSAFGEPIAMPTGEGGTPQLVGRIGPDRVVRFVIDTGAQGNSLDAALFDDLAEQNLIQPGRTFASLTIVGEMHGLRGKLENLTVGPFTQRGLRMSRINLNSIGLRYFSRYQVTFDFPGERMYLKRGSAYGRAEPAATSGMTIIWNDGEPTIEAVRPRSPGASAGLEPLDVLVRVNDRPAAEFDPFALRELFTSSAGRKVPLQVRRAGREFAAELVLEED
jgi:PDZ domain